MAISFNTGTTATAGNGVTSIAVTIPAGVLVGDVMLMSLSVFTQTSSAPTVSFSGAGGTWTAIPVSTGSNPIVSTAGSSNWSYGYGYYRVATAGDPGASLTITESGSAAGTTWFAVAIASYTGATTATPVDVAGSAANAANSGTVTCPTLNTGVSGDWAVFLGSGAPGAGVTYAGPAGSTSRENTVSAAGVGAAVNDSNAVVGGSGTSIGGGTFTATPPGSDWMIGFTVGLEGPAVVPPPAPQFVYMMRRMP